MTDAADRLKELVRQHWTPGPSRLGVAVSGGSDSLALLHLLADWAAEGGPDLSVVTVDHGLRPEARTEAEAVSAICSTLGFSHDILTWDGWDQTGNLPDQARRARYGLIAGWAATRGLDDVALGHTADDQAETFLLRLMRGSGVDGLSAMAARRRAQGLTWHRPLLAARRADLRQFLTARGVGWIDDPTNEDPAYDRVKVRQAMTHLAPLGLTVEALVATAVRLRLARQALDHLAQDTARRAAKVEAGDVILDRAFLAEAPEETRLRLIAHALVWVSGADYRPRLAALRSACDQIAQGKRVTLHGCLLMPRQKTLRITREWAAVANITSPPDQPWDGRWHLTGPMTPGLRVGALGESGLKQCPDWRATGLPRATLLASPALWDGDRLIAAPLAGQGNGWVAKLPGDGADFMAKLIVH